MYTISTQVVCVKVADIRKKGYQNLQEWINNANNVYIARGGIVFIDKKRFPPTNSIWANPYKIDKNNDRDTVIQKYRTHLMNKIKKNEIKISDIIKLRDKTLGCWCKEGGKDVPCHGDVIVEFLVKIMECLEKRGVDPEGMKF
jgi:hypothetical protein